MEKNRFEKEPVLKLIASMAIPTMIGQLGTIIYNMADTFFIGQLNDVNQVAAISVTMPVFLILMSIGALFGIGGASYISRMMGNQNIQEMKKASSLVFYLSIGVGLGMMVLGILMLDPILSWIGCNPQSYAFAKEYLFVILLGSVFIVISNSFSFILRSVGMAKQAMIGLVLGTVLNIILDPIFIMAVHMGVQGAAIATVLSNILTAVLYVLCYIHIDSLSWKMRDLSLERYLIKNILSIGIPGALVTILLSVSNILLNNFCVQYGNNCVAAIGIVSKINLFPIQLTVGLGQGIQPLLGYYIGSDNKDRLRETMKKSHMISFLMGVFFVIVFFVSKEFLMELFIRNQTIIDLGKQYLMLVSISTPILGSIFVFSTYFQSAGLAKPALLMSIARQGLFYVPIIILGNIFLQDTGVILAQPCSDILCFLMAYFFYRKGINEPTENVLNN